MIVSLQAVSKWFVEFTPNFRGLVRLFRKTKSAPVLKQVSFAIDEGERVGLIGTNGSGKSTLLRIILGATTPSEGAVFVSGKPVGLLGSGVGFDEKLAGRENARNYLTLFGFSRREIPDRLARIESFVELGRFFDFPVRTYSAGMRARLEFACVTEVVSSFVVIDEVLGAGDGYFTHKASSRMMQLLSKGSTAVIVSHDMNQILTFSDRVIWLNEGVIRADGESRAVIDSYTEWCAARIKSSDGGDAVLKDELRDDFKSILENNNIDAGSLYNMKNDIREVELNSNLLVELSVGFYDGLVKIVIIRRGFGIVWKSNESSVRQASNVAFSLKAFPFGVGNYLISIVGLSAHSKKWKVLAGEIVCVPHSNVSDSPLVHLDADVRLKSGAEVLVMESARLKTDV